MERRACLQCAILVLFVGSYASGVGVTSIHVPQFARVGDSVQLKCLWEVGNVPVYTVKWYFGSHEFYRWTPAERPSIQVFGLSAFQVDRDASDQNVVVLRNITLKAAGLFKCEVSGEKPSFPTDHKLARLRIIDPPKSGPFLTGLSNPYQINELVSLNCTSPPSNPPADLSFYFNGEPVDDAWILNYPKEKPGSPLLGLRFPLRSRLADQLPIVIKCSSSIPDMYYNSAEVEVKPALTFQASMEGRTSRGGVSIETALLVLVSSFSMNFLL